MTVPFFSYPFENDLFKSLNGYRKCLGIIKSSKKYNDDHSKIFLGIGHKIKWC